MIWNPCFATERSALSGRYAIRSNSAKVRFIQQSPWRMDSGPNSTPGIFIVTVYGNSAVALADRRQKSVLKIARKVAVNGADVGQGL